MYKLRLILRLAAYLLITLFFLPFIILLDLIGLNALKMGLIGVYYQCAARSWGVRVKLQGKFAKERPLLVVSNHCSYVDIPVLGSLAPLHFTPKSEISGWPVVGFLCRLADCVFINRNPRKTVENMAELQKAMDKGWMISLFPEGTTNDGTQVLTFRSSYFSLAEQGLAVQPVTVIYTNRDGSPLSPQAMRKVAWIGDDEFAPHLFDFLKQPAIQATVICHDLTHIEKFEGRKALAAHSHQLVHDCLKKEGVPQGNAQ